MTDEELLARLAVLAEACAAEREIRFRYKNHRGAVEDRTASCVRLRFIKTDWHPLQWVLEAYDFGRQALRDFAVLDMEGVK